MPTRHITLRRIVNHLNNPDEGGGFWLPNIQRPFVWSEDQICRLFDSILREYPISTLLVWRTLSGIRRRKFIDNWRSSLRLSDFYVPEDNRQKNLVLDGQQRLQSLYIGLKGSYDGKELYFDILSGGAAAPDDIRFKFAFRRAEDSAFPWVRFKDLVMDNRLDGQIFRTIEATAVRELSAVERNTLEENVNRVSRSFKQGEDLSYQELDSIDNPTLFTEDDVVEIFIRANAGGTRLGKSDLLFSLLAAGWDTADEELESLLDSAGRHGFALTRDFVLKTCLTLVGQKASYEVEKFRKPGVRDDIERNWKDIREALEDVLDFVKSKTFIQCDKALPSYNILIPLVYLRYKHRGGWNAARGMDQYLLRASLAGAFSGRPDQLIDSLVDTVEKDGAFDLDRVYGVIRTQGRSLELTEDRFWRMGYGSDNIHLLFNLWYRDSFNYTPAYSQNMPQVDHIFPQSALKAERRVNPETNRLVLRYYEEERNQLANCMLLSAEENGAGGKTSTLPATWLDPDQIGSRNASFGPTVPKAPDHYYDLHLIPRDPALWSIDRYVDFVEARKALIRKRFAHLLVPNTEAASA